MLHHNVFKYLSNLENNFSGIPDERKKIIEKLSLHVAGKLGGNFGYGIMYVCIHNSRRSHFGQAWGAASAAYYGIHTIFTYSGGVEVTAIHLNTLAALQRAGWLISEISREEESNPVYYGQFSRHLPPVVFFSKKMEHRVNPEKNFAAVLTCGEAEENCPFVPGADVRISLSYSDPKTADGTPQEKMVYDERCRQIALENLYLFKKVRDWKG